MLGGTHPKPVSIEDEPDEDGRPHPTSTGSYQTFPAPVSAPTSPPAPSALGPEQVSPIAPPGPPTSDPGNYFASAPDDLNLPSTTNMPLPGSSTFNPPGAPPVIPSPSSHDPAGLPPAPFSPPDAASTPQDFYRHTPRPPQRQVPPQAPPARRNYFSQPSQPVAPAQHYGGNSGSSNALNTDDMAIVQAQKHAKWAISALNFEDVPTAVRELQAALATLGAR